MNQILQHVCCASLPAESLVALAAVRACPDVRVAIVEDRAWVRWDSADDTVLRAVLPIAGVELFEQRGALWYRHGRHLPFDFPSGADFRPLCQVLFPKRLRPIKQRPLSGPPMALTLVPDSQPRPATALRCDITELVRWADVVPARRIATLQAAWCEGRVLVLGRPLPAVGSGERLWGDSVLAPLGYRPHPRLPASAIREALQVNDDELLLLSVGSIEAVPFKAFAPLSRAQLRLAVAEATS